MRGFCLAMLPAVLAAQDAQPLQASMYFGMKASNYYRESGQGDHFFGQRGFFQLETQQVWLGALARGTPLVLFSSIVLEGKRQDEYNPQGSAGVLDYSRKVVRESSAYSAEVGLRQALNRTCRARFFIVLSTTFRNVSQQDIPATGTSAQPESVYSDKSRASGKLALQLRDDAPDTFKGSFAEVGVMKDEFYADATRRFLFRGRLAVRLTAWDAWKTGGAPNTVGYFLEGSINRGLGGTSLNEKDESVIIAGLQFQF